MAKLLKADHTRRIELEGVGPAPRPVDIDDAQTGFRALKTLRIYRFAPPAIIKGHAEEDEVLIVVLSGAVELQMLSEHWSRNDVRFDLKAAQSSAAVSCAAYLPPHAGYVLTPRSAAEVAYARARPAGARAPAVFTTRPQHGAGSHLLLDVSSHAERLGLQLWQADAGDTAAELMAWDSSTPSEALIHVRATPERSLVADAPGVCGITLDSWDTLAVPAGERPKLRMAPHSSATGLVVRAV